MAIKESNEYGDTCMTMCLSFPYNISNEARCVSKLGKKKSHQVIGEFQL